MEHKNLVETQLKVSKFIRNWKSN